MTSRKAGQRRPFLLRLALAAATALGALPLAAEPFAIADSGFLPSGGWDAIHWLDDRRVLFLGHDAARPGEGYALVEWEVGRKPEVLRHGVAHICARAGGFVMMRLRTAAGAPRSYLAGPLGSERPIAEKDADFLWCAPDRAARPGGADRDIRRLRAEHGYVDLGPRRGAEALKNVPGIYHRADGIEVTLPLKRWDWSSARFFAWRDAYLIRVHPRAADPEVGKPPVYAGPEAAYWLFPDGRVEKLPYGTPITAQHPTRAGLVYRDLDVRTRNFGLKLLTPQGDTVDVARGYITDVAVSPSGCRIAFTYAADQKSFLFPNPRRTLRVADLCKR